MKFFKPAYEHLGYVISLSTILALSSTWFWAQGYDLVFNGLAVISILLIYPGIILGVFVKIKNFDKYTKSIKKLFILYMEVIVAFASTYIWFILLTSNEAFHGFENIGIITVSKESFEFKAYLKDLVLIIIDSFHYSVVTATTLGYGDVYPKSALAKLVVDFQVLSSLAIAIFGAGKYFEFKQKTH